MKQIDPTAVIGPDVRLAKDVRIGPGCHFDGPIEIGPGNEFMGYNFIRGPLKVGEGNRFYPFACIGLEPQDYKFDPSRTGAGTVIGSRNIFREQVTIHRATSDAAPTRVGDSNMFMVGSHAGHDVTVGNRCVFANNALLAGHAVIYDQVNFGGGAAVGQKIAVGRLAFLSGTAGAPLHIPPFMMARALGSVGGINLIGLRRSGMDREEIDNVKWAFRVIFLQSNTRPAVIDALEPRAGRSPAVAEIVEFLQRHSGPIAELEPGKESRAMLRETRIAPIADEHNAGACGAARSTPAPTR